MNRFLIGDKVRFLHGTEEGVVKKYLSADTLEIVLTDGFEIPVNIIELAPIAKKEIEKPAAHSNINQYIKELPKVNDLLPKNPILYVYQKEEKLVIGLFNNTNETLLHAFYAQPNAANQRNEWKGLSFGILEPNEKESIYEDFKANIQNTYKWLISYQSFNNGYHIKQAQANIEFKVDKSIFQKPGINLFDNDSKVYLINNIENQKIEKKLDPEIIRANMLEKKYITADNNLSNQKLVRPTLTIDLHAEKLFKSSDMPPTEFVLMHQLEQLDIALNKAIAENCASLIIIHGIGTGKLKQSILYKIKRIPQVKTFKDAQKEKFGYGATEVFFN